jgi:hypothetical protein
VGKDRVHIDPQEVIMITPLNPRHLADTIARPL